MGEKLEHVLQRIDSKHLSKLWSFYRDYFNNDEDCLSFIYNAIRLEPVDTFEQAIDKSVEHFNDDEYTDPNDKFFIPRRMLNCVERMVSAARDMEQIRRGKDVFKIVFLVTCIETLQKLSGCAGQKKEMLFDFFKGYTSEKDKNYIRKHFAHGSQGLYDDEDSFEQFIGVLNEYRNCAAHEGEYWDYCFKNDSGRTPLSIIVKIDLDKYSMKNKIDHSFETTLSYRYFEAIFVRTCISFINSYVRSMPKDTEEDAEA